MDSFNKSGWLVALLLFLNAAALRAETAPTNSPWAHVVMVGASASAGFVLSEPLGGTNTLNCRLNFFVDAALAAPHEPVRNLASALFFMNPDGTGQLQMTQLLKEQPSLVLGVDFLFWFCYGQGATDAERLQRFERGLKLLETVTCPLVLGDIPDASFATNTGIISPAQVPSPAARLAANRRLQEWAATRPQVAIMPLSDFLRAVMADQAITLRGRTLLPEGKTHALLQSDQLHPNSLGAAALAVGILDAFLAKHADIPGTAVCWNPAEVMQTGRASAQTAQINPVKPPAQQAAGPK